MSKSEDLMVQFAERLIQSFDSTSDFVATQAPDVVQQLIAFKITVLSLGVLTASVLLALAITLIIQAIAPKSAEKAPHLYDSWGLKDSYTVPRYLVGIVMCFGSIVWLSIDLVDLIMVIIAPKVFILEYASKLL